MTETGTGTGTGTRSNPLVRAVTVALVCCLVAGLLVPAPAAAGDSISTVSLETDDADVESGDAVTLDLVVSNHGDYSGNGVGELSFTIDYDADVFAVADVEHGPMLIDGDPDVDVEGTVENDEEAGTLTVTQERVPAGDGAIATESAATITLEVADDAPQTTESIDVAESSVTLVTDYPQSTFERDAEIDVNGGSDEDDSSGADGDDTNDTNDDAPAGVTLADESNGTDSNGDEAGADDEGDEGEDAADEADSISGFGVGAAIVAVSLLLGRRIRR